MSGRISGALAAMVGLLSCACGSAVTRIPPEAPRYRVTSSPDADSTHCDAGTARLIDVTSGRMVARLGRPRGVCQWRAMSSMVGDHTFFLYASVGDSPQTENARVYRLRINGRNVTLASVMGSEVAGMADPVGIAATPDGTKVAFSVDALHGDRHGVGIVDVTTGRHTSLWTTRPANAPKDLSWAADDRTLAFTGPDNAIYRVIDTGNARDLVRDSRPVASGGGFGYLSSAVISGDGRTLYTITHERTEGRAIDRVVAVPVSGMGATKIVYHKTYPPMRWGGTADKGTSPPTFITSLCRERDGRHLLITTADSHLVRIPLPGGRIDTRPANAADDGTAC